MIGIIVAMNADRIIGVNGTIPWFPWSFKGYQARFKRITMGSTVIMGRRTWESIPTKYRPLGGRENIVIAGSQDAVWNRVQLGRPPRSLYVVRDIERALKIAAVDNRDVWFIGGARIYAEAMQYADVIDVTWVPWQLECDCRPVHETDGHALTCALCNQARFPPIDEIVFAPGPVEVHPNNADLKIQRFTRRT